MEANQIIEPQPKTRAHHLPNRICQYYHTQCDTSWCIEIKGKVQKRQKLSEWGPTVDLFGIINHKSVNTGDIYFFLQAKPFSVLFEWQSSASISRESVFRTIYAARFDGGDLKHICLHYVYMHTLPSLRNIDFLRCSTNQEFSFVFQKENHCYAKEQI